MPHIDIPDFDDINFNVNMGNFDPEEIETDETINAVFVVDTSYSIKDYVYQLNAAFNDFVETMQKSHVAERLFVSIIEFSNTIEVTSGFQPISAIRPMDFSKAFGGATALYDAVKLGVENAIAYRDNLENSGVETKTLLFVITDGDDNHSKNPPHLVKRIIDDLNKDERSAFSFTSILFGVGNEADFDNARKEMGIEHLAKVGTTGDDMRKMIGFISQSISSASAGHPPPSWNF